MEPGRIPHRIWLVAGILAFAGCRQPASAPSTPATVLEGEEASACRTARARLEEARSAHASADFDRARELVSTALSEFEPAPGAGGVSECVEVAVDLVSLASDLADPSIELAAVEVAIALREREVPVDEPALRRLRLHRATAIRGTGDLGAARAELEALRAAWEASLAPEDPLLRTCLHALAITLDMQGQNASARDLQERVVALARGSIPADGVEFLRMRSNLALMRRNCGDLQGARELQEALLAEVEASRGPSDEETLLLRSNLGISLMIQGDMARARGLLEEVVSTLETRAPAGDEVLLDARDALGTVLRELGYAREAREQAEQVLAERERTLPRDHPARVRALANLALLLKSLGELERASDLETQVLESFERGLPAGHSLILRAKGNLAVSLKRLGRLTDARVLEESVLEGFLKSSGAHDPNLQTIRLNLATTYSDLEEIPAAREMLEAAVDEMERTFPEDYADLQRARAALATVLESGEDLHGARALRERSLEILERTLGEEHPDLPRARLGLARLLSRMGEHGAASALCERAFTALERAGREGTIELEVARLNWALIELARGNAREGAELAESTLSGLEGILPPDHPDLQAARMTAAIGRVSGGDLDGARGLLELTVESLEGRVPPDSTELIAARIDLGLVEAVRGDLPAARLALLELEPGIRAAVDGLLLLSPREAAERAASLRRGVAAFLPFAGDEEAGGPEAGQLFALMESLRAASVEGGRTRGDAEFEELREVVASLRSRIHDLVAPQSLGGGTNVSDPDELAVLVARRDRAESELRRRQPLRGGVVPWIDPGAVAAALPPDASAGVVVRCSLDASALGGMAMPIQEDELFALVVRKSGDTRLVRLGPASRIESAATRWRESLGEPITAARGRPVAPGVSAKGEAVLDPGIALRRILLDPLIAATEGSRRFFLCLDDVLHAVPLDALPLDPTTGAEARTDPAEVVGDRIAIHLEISLGRLLSGGTTAASVRELVVFGGIDYDAGTEAPSEARAAIRSPFRWAALEGTEAEARSVADQFETAFSLPARRFGSGAATKDALRVNARDARFLHIATHGYFAPELLVGGAGGEPESAGWRTPEWTRTLRGLAPMTLCGLALAGANGAIDSVGQAPGLLTAEELSGFDLSGCELAVLSACETNVGIRRSGLGIQSLQTALHAAGARTAITSLWKVDDAATRRLFELFYTRLWRESLGKAEALWEAKRELRAEGSPLRDWGAWVLTGAPN
ncbi:MAG: CHAT domain-containing protein [Planctomycetota bacterium]